MDQHSINKILQNDHKAIAKAISLIENSQPGFEELLKKLSSKKTPVIGITGPPGAGKSSLVDALTESWVKKGEKVAIICVDPSSPFHSGALLGDRIRMSKWFNYPEVFIRSLASRGALGGLHPRIMEITELLKSAGFDYIIIETVGVGQSEIEIAGLADTTIVVMIPEGGDEIQTMKSGIMEIADIFVVNKSDRPGADQFVIFLKKMLAPAFSKHLEEVPILKTIATSGEGIDELKVAIDQKLQTGNSGDKKIRLLAEKAYHLINQARMRDIKIDALAEAIQNSGNSFNMYSFIKRYT